MQQESSLIKWKTTSSKYLVNDRWLKLRADACIAADGRTKDPYYIIESPDWINCLVIEGDDTVVMLRHYRHGITDYVLEIVGGVIDQTDVSPLAAVTRELDEELGYAGGQIFQTGICYPNPAMLTNKNYSFLAVGGTCHGARGLEAGEDFVIERYKFPEFLQRIQDPNSEVYQSLHLTNIFFALNLIKNSGEEVLQPLKKYL